MSGSVIGASVESSRPSGEDRGTAFAVPPPTSALMSAFVQARPRRPVYRPAPGIAVPRLEQVPSGEGYLVVPVALHEFRRAPEAVLQPRVGAWLDQPDAQAARRHELDRRDLAQLSALAAAALHDIAGLSQRAVTEWFSPTITWERRRALMRGEDACHGDTRTTRRRIARGRKLWVQLAGWPWWPIDDSNGGDALSRLPKRWWELPRVVETYDTWTRSPTEF
jgi:hypothetical protein